MDSQELTAVLQNWAALAAAVYTIAGTLGTTFRRVLDIVQPDHNLTEEEINAIELAGIADSQRRQADRQAMAQPAE